MEINPNQKRLLAHLLLPMTVRDTGRDIIRQRNDKAAVDITRGVSVMVFDVDISFRAIVAWLHGDILIQGHCCFSSGFEVKCTASAGQGKQQVMYNCERQALAEDNPEKQAEEQFAE